MVDGNGGVHIPTGRIYDLLLEVRDDVRVLKERDEARRGWDEKRDKDISSLKFRTYAIIPGLMAGLLAAIGLLVRSG